MSEHPWIAKAGRGGQIQYRVRLSESGLHVEIETHADGRLLGAAYISRFDWPLVVELVDQTMRQAAMIAQAENVVNEALYGNDD